MIGLVNKYDVLDVAAEHKKTCLCIKEVVQFRYSNSWQNLWLWCEFYKVAFFWFAYQIQLEENGAHIRGMSQKRQRQSVK